MAAVHFTRYACSSYSPSLTDPGRGGDSPAPKILFGFELDQPMPGASVAGLSRHKLHSCIKSGRCLFSSLNLSTNGKGNERQLPL